MTDAAGNRWTWTYDLLGRQIATGDPDKGSTTSVFDDAGRLLSGTDARGITLATTYDNLDRKTGEVPRQHSGQRLAAWTYGHAPPRASSPHPPVRRAPTPTPGPSPDTTRNRPLGTTSTLPAGPLAGSYTSTLTYNPDGSPATRTDRPRAAYRRRR